jgi:acetyl esterase/lipase
VLHAPWVDLTTSTPETDAYDEVDPWLFKGKMRTYAQWWAGTPEDLGRPEVSPGLGDLSGLPPALMFYGTRDLLAPGCRLLRRRAAEAGWDLTAVEERGLIHVYPLLPYLPEARKAFARTVEFVR